jgi:hypothetical protein
MLHIKYSPFFRSQSISSNPRLHILCSLSLFSFFHQCHYDRKIGTSGLILYHCVHVISSLPDINLYSWFWLLCQQNRHNTFKFFFGHFHFFSNRKSSFMILSLFVQLRWTELTILPVVCPTSSSIPQFYSDCWVTLTYGGDTFRLSLVPELAFHCFFVCHLQLD